MPSLFWRLLIITILMAETSQLMSATPLIVAHRGASNDAPENTISAFKLAWEQGADAIEGDFRLTGDGQIVCFHDATTEKLTSRKLTIAHSTLQQLQELDVGVHFGNRFKKAQIPTLSQVFTTIPEGKKIYIEIKCGPEILPALYAEIKRAELTEEQIVIITFDRDLIKILKHHAPGLKALWLASFKKNWRGKIKPDPNSIIKTLDEINADGLSSNPHAIVTKSFVTGLKSEGYEYHVWTVDDPDVAMLFTSMGTTSITSNVPKVLLNSLK